MHALVYICLFFAQTDFDAGADLFQKDNYAAAVGRLLKATDANPRDATAWKALGAAYAAQNLYLEAEPALRRACELDSKLLDACYYHARALYALDRFDGSLAVLERVTPKSWKVRVAIAQSFEALGKAAEAEREFRAPPGEAQVNSW